MNTTQKKPRYVRNHKPLGLWWSRSYRYADSIGWVCRKCQAHSHTHQLDPRPTFCRVCGLGSRHVKPEKAWSRSSLSYRSEQPELGVMVVPPWIGEDLDPLEDELDTERVR